FCIYLLPSFSTRPRSHLALHSFPTRRSSDLVRAEEHLPFGQRPFAFLRERAHVGPQPPDLLDVPARAGSDVDVGSPVQEPHRDRSESTRLNSSHDQISYAVFCLKKKKKKK